MAKKKKANPKRLKQKFLPGMKPKSLPSIDTAADLYVEARDERIELSKHEKHCKNDLIFKMGKAGLHAYETPDGLMIRLSDTHEVKVERKKKQKGSDEEW